MQFNIVATIIHTNTLWSVCGVPLEAVSKTVHHAFDALVGGQGVGGASALEGHLRVLGVRRRNLLHSGRLSWIRAARSCRQMGIFVIKFYLYLCLF